MVPLELDCSRSTLGLGEKNSVHGRTAPYTPTNFFLPIPVGGGHDPKTISPGRGRRANCFSLLFNANNWNY